MTGPNDNDRGTDFDDDVYDAMRRAGFVYPDTPEEVEKVERELAENPVLLPDQLADVSRVFDVISRPSATNAKDTIRLPENPEIRIGLARAAREGQELSEDLIQRMRQDRKAAEGNEDG